MKNTAYIGLGSNIGDSLTHCKSAVQKIRKNPSIRVTKVSSWTQTKPWGYLNQSDFMNGAIEIQTSLSAFDLLMALQGIEKDMGRKPSLKWGPRLIDLDILLYNHDIIRTKELTIPHPQIHKREFVKRPLLELNVSLKDIFNFYEQNRPD